jgi:tetratricopeptide (TPR) repeat protein
MYSEAKRIYRRLAQDAARRRQAADQGESLLAVARIEWLSGRYPQALRQTSRVLRVASGGSAGGLAAQAHFLIGETARRTGGMQRAQTALEHAVKLFGRMDESGPLADALNALGLVHWSCGRLDAAQQHFLDALRASTRSSNRRDPVKHGQIANNLGILLEERGRLHAAERYYRKAFDAFDRLGHRRNRAYSLGNLANLYRQSASYERARSAYDEVEMELLSIGEQHAAAYTVGNRGDLARDFGDWASAAELYHRTLHFASHVNDAELIAESYCRLADIQLAKKHYGEALRLLKKASTTAEKAQSREFAIRVHLLRAEIDLAGEHIPDAKRAFAAAELEAADTGLLYYLLWAKSGLGRCLLLNGRLNEAYRIARRCLVQARRAGYRWWEFRCAVLGAQVEHHEGTWRRCALNEGKGMLQTATALKEEIEATIGDPSIRATFAGLPLIHTLQVLGHRNATSEPTLLAG